TGQHTGFTDGDHFGSWRTSQRDIKMPAAIARYMSSKAVGDHPFVVGNGTDVLTDLGVVGIIVERCSSNLDCLGQHGVDPRFAGDDPRWAKGRLNGVGNSSGIFSDIKHR